LQNWRALAVLFFTTSTLESVAMGHLSAFTPLYLTGFGLSPEDVARLTGLLTAGTMAIAFPLSPLWGAIAERYARKPVVVRSQFAEAVAYALLAFAPDLPWVVAARLLLGLAFGNVAILIAVQTLLTPPRRVGSAIATVQSAMPIAASLGPPLGAALLPHIGVRTLFVLDAAACLTAGLLIAFLMPEPSTPRSDKPVLTAARHSLAMVWQRPPLRWNFAAWFLVRGATAVLSAYIPVKIVSLTDDPAPAIGLVLGVYGAIMAVATWLGGQIADRVDPLRLFWPAMVVATVSITALALAPTLPLLAASVWVSALPTAVSSTLLYMHLTQTVAPAERAPILALTPVPRNTAMFVLPAVAGLLAGLSVGAALGVAAVAFAAATGTGWVLAALSRAHAPQVVAASSPDAAPDTAPRP
jgi:predicted MFS family arabinose efflux permease